MVTAVRGFTSLIGRSALVAIFLLSAIANKIPKFPDVVRYMASKGMPIPELMLVGAIVFLIAGSVSLIIGYKARLGAFLLLVFLGLASYFFHDFWRITDPQGQQAEMIQFLKNLSMMGAMLLVMANGVGPWSVDSWTSRSVSPPK